MKTLSTYSSLERQILPQIWIPKEQSTILPVEMLHAIFAKIKNLNLKTIHNLSLACSEWKQITESSIFWENVFSKAGIPLPVNPKFSLHHAFAYETGDLLANKIRSCNKPVLQEINTYINFTTCEHFHFIEDTHIITFIKNAVYICPLDQKTPRLNFTFEARIYSFCSVEKTVYCSLDNGEIIAFSIGDESDILEFAYITCQYSNLCVKPKKIFANNKWIIGIIQIDQYTIIQKWERSTQKLISVSKNPGMQMIDTQIFCNKLYWHSKNLRGVSALYYIDLDMIGDPIFIKNLDKGVINLSIRGDRCFYNAMRDMPNYTYEYYVVNFALNMEDPSYETKVTLLGNIGLSSLAISVHQDNDTSRFMQADQSTLEIIDIKNGGLLKNVTIGSINNIRLCDRSSLTKIFQDSIFHIKSGDKVVKITFP